MTHNVIHLENGKLAQDTPRQRVHEIVERAISNQGGGGIVLHFHGGLVNESAGRDTAARLKPVYEAAGAYPVFFVWEAGLTETVGNNLGELAQEPFFRRLWSRVASIVGRKLKQDEGSRSGQALPEDPDQHPDTLEDAIARALDEEDPGKLPPEIAPVDGLSFLTDFERATLEQDLAGDFPLVTDIQKVSNGLLTPAEAAAEAESRGAGALAVGSTETLMDPEALERFIDRPAPGSRGIISSAKMIKALVAIAARVIARYVKDRDHGLHATVVEEILREFYVARVGGTVWSLMKGDTRDAFKADANIYGGSAFLEELKIQAGDSPPRITLVGHSTGAVFICEFLERAHQLLGDGFTFDVVFLAPAVTCSRFQKALDGQADLIRNFRMFTMKDDLERADVLVPVLYPHSLLYFVSGVVEEEADMPLVGMERYDDVGDYPGDEFRSVDAVRTFLRFPERVFWSNVQAGNGKATMASSHGDFDNDPPTLGSIDHLLRTNWA